MDRKQQNEDRFSEKEHYRKKIIEMVNGINNRSILEYLETFIRLYIEKWG